MAVTSGQVSVGSSATVIYTGTDEPVSLYIHDDSANSVFIGPAGVTTTTGYEVDTSAVLKLELKPNDDIYGVSAAGGDTVSWLVVST